MKSVSRFEANLLRVLQSFLGRAPAQQAADRVLRESAPPPCLSRAAVELIQDRLGKGVVWQLAQTGWRRERHLRDGRVVTGRLWERTPPEELGLTFSGHALEFLLWIMTADARDDKRFWRPSAGELTVGDRFVCYLALQTLRGTEAGKLLAGHEILQGDGLIRLAFPDLIQDVRVNIDWQPWTTGVGACILEALQGPLRDRWCDIERGKDRIVDKKHLIALGRSQQTVLCSFADAVTTAQRWDLARFLLHALANALPDTAQARMSAVRLDGLRMADHQAVHAAALAFVRHIDVFQQWEARGRTIGYFDDGYAAAQLWMADWEAVGGDDLHRRAQALLRDLDPLQ